MRNRIKLFFLCLLFSSAAVVSAEQGLSVKGVRHASHADFTRIVFELESAAPHVLTRSADGRELALTGNDGTLALRAPLPSVSDGVVNGLELRRNAGKAALIVRLSEAAGETKNFALREPDRIVLDVSRVASSASPAPAADKRVVIVLDPGHGGRDTGIVTAQGYEKTATLDFALAVRALLRTDPRFTVVLTREKDQDIGLDERAAVANTANAAIFVSIHGASGTGSQVFFQSISDEAGTQPVPAAGGDFLGYETGSEQRELAWGGQQAAHRGESSVLGGRIARQLAGNESVQADQIPLAGLKAVNAAAVMVELGMGREKAPTAEAVAGGIRHYVNEER